MLRVAGTDAATFLQGQFTNDLRGLAEGPSIYGLWLTVKGKVAADSFLAKGGSTDEFWITSYKSPAAAIRGRLESHIIADDVVIEDLTSEWDAVSLFGDVAGIAPDTGKIGFVFAGRRARPANREWIFPVTQRDEVRRQLARFPELDPDTVERGRIRAGIALVPVDAGPGDLPNEAGLEAEAISYQKGCYLGQEVMARLKSMGQVRRRLVRVHAAINRMPALPAPLYSARAQAGELRSAVWDEGGFIGLAMISRLKVEAGAQLALAPGGATVIRLLENP